MKTMTLERTALHIGADKPFELLHVSDTHIALADERDDQRKRELAAARSKAFEEETPGCFWNTTGKAAVLPTNAMPFWFTQGICSILFQKNILILLPD